MSDREPPVVTHEAQDPFEFSIPVEIEGLPYVFRGTLPAGREPFRLSVHVPDWQAYLGDIGIAAQSGLGLPMGDFGRHQGEIGFIVLDKGEVADTFIRNIQSATWIMPEDSPYFEAHRIGSFLLNNLLALADLRKWSVSAKPLPYGRTNMDLQGLRGWYLKKGFVDDGGQGMVRAPQQPDMTQAITQIVQSQAVTIPAGVVRR